MAEGYSETVLDHVDRPRNPGVIEQPDGAGIERNPVCGDLLTLTLRIVGGRITAARQEVRGCTGSIAAASVLTELLTGVTLDEAAAITPQVITDALGGLPPHRLHSATLAASALRKALAFHQARLAP